MPVVSAPPLHVVPVERVLYFDQTCLGFPTITCPAKSVKHVLRAARADAINSSATVEITIPRTASTASVGRAMERSSPVIQARRRINAVFLPPKLYSTFSVPVVLMEKTVPPPTAPPLCVVP